MNSFIGFILLFTFGASSLQLTEWCKIPLLIQHFQHHKAKNHSLSSFSYLKHHYLNEPYDDNDDDKDKQLPFKTRIEYPGNLFFLFAPNESIVRKSPAIAAEFNSRYLMRREKGFLLSIFHPPCS